jgi:hypothetical protein
MIDIMASAEIISCSFSPTDTESSIVFLEAVMHIVFCSLLVGQQILLLLERGLEAAMFLPLM